MVKNMQKQPHIQEVKALDAFCDQCGSNHDASECGQQVESSCYVGNFNRNNMSNTYNPTWRNHPNFSWKNQNNTLNPQQPTQSGFQNQPRQNPQPLPRQEFQQPTEYKSLENTLNQFMAQTSAYMARTDRFIQKTEDHQIPQPTMGESSAESLHAQSNKPEEMRPPPPFPQRLKKQKQDYQFKKFLDILKQVHINLPLVEALQQMPNYAKFVKDMVTRKKRIEEFETAATTETCLALMHNKVPAKKTDPDNFTIECFIGHNYPTKALCDPGANHSYVQPEGKIEDILVQVDKFIFPADFLILDCEADEYAPIILGRPFLSTSRAVIDFDNDEIIFKVENNSVKMKSLTKKLNKGKNIADAPAKEIPRAKLYMGAHVERDRAAMSLRDA
ncbi:hypothetical protein V6N13_053580 [Hibiscus sabdariffa]